MVDEGITRVGQSSDTAWHDTNMVRGLIGTLGKLPGDSHGCEIVSLSMFYMCLAVVFGWLVPCKFAGVGLAGTPVPIPMFHTLLLYM